MRLISLSRSWEKKNGSAGPVSPGACAKRLLRLQRRGELLRSHAESGKGCEFELKAAQKAATAVPGEELAPEARGLHLCDAALSSSPGLELFLFVWRG